MPITDDIIRLEIFVNSPFQGLLTPEEFAEVMNISASAVRHAIKSGRLRPGIDCMKFGKQWVLSKSAFPVFDKYGRYAKYLDLKRAYNNHPERGKPHDNVNISDEKAGD